MRLGRVGIVVAVVSVALALPGCDVVATVGGALLEDAGPPDGGTAVPDGGDGGAVPRPDGGAPRCGDGLLQAGEACDDGDTEGGDGCLGDCTAVEPRFACPFPGMDCVRVVTCGNGRIEGPETCDDRNVLAGDGCDADCVLEPGWVCALVGAACRAARCGDGLVAGLEVCDDGGRCDGALGTACTADADCVAAGDGAACVPTGNDGCSGGCQLEEGFACDAPGTACRATVCGDGVAEGTEDCDDGNPQIGDGCTPFCAREPSCTDGRCTAVCGDEVVFAPETCDDGNVVNGDGCSSACQEEVGWACEEVPLPAPDAVVLPIVLRDFIAGCGGTATGERAQEGVAGAVPPYGHPDFQCYNGAERGMVEPVLVDGVPVRAAGATRIASDASFARWYRSNDDFNRTVVQAMTFGALAGSEGAYRFDSSSFFPLSTPIDGSMPAGFPTEMRDGARLERLASDGGGSGNQNFFFTSEVRFWFRYEGTENLAFSGDDDVWVFINGRLAVDIGGVHGREDGAITLSECASDDPAANDPGCESALDLWVGGIYEAVVFQAERRHTRSQYRLTLSNFERAPSTCAATCGDGVVASIEACDDGAANGAAYDGCSATCSLTPFCGDALVQADFGEVCDDGLNLGGSASACAPGCKEVGGRCGDGVVQTELGEECDDGNTTSRDGCSADCRFELR